ncbi:MAG: amino acid permease [Edaphobacter sp.]|nr:amino acid permease [Edaphobacter sp.]
MTTVGSMQNQTTGSGQQLDRGMSLAGAVSTNILNMVGVGPFLTIPLALAAMGGPQAMLGWILGAVLCLCDGMVWAELGSALPRSGGPYHYLLQAFGPKGWGRLISFLFLWQSLLIGPLSIASGAVGFGEYASFLAPHLRHGHLVLIAMALCLLNTALLYRNIRSISIVSIVIMTAVVGTCAWIIISGATHFNTAIAFSFPAHAFHPSRAFWFGLGSATLIAVYDYGGYNNVCLIGEEVQEPRKTIPRAVIFSIVLVAILYLAMNLSILGTVPWQQGQYSKAIVADYMEMLYGHWGGVLVSGFVLIAGWGSVFAILLGFSRVPYTAAVDGHFFKPFARLHPTERFPSTSLLVMGGLSAVACLFSLADLISVLIVVQTMFQFAAQCVAVILLRRKTAASAGAFRMPFYPLPALVALAGWSYIVISSKPSHIAIGFGMALIGTTIYLLQAKKKLEWPFHQHDEL